MRQGCFATLTRPQQGRDRGAAGRFRQSFEVIGAVYHARILPRKFGFVTRNFNVKSRLSAIKPNTAASIQSLSKSGGEFLAGWGKSFAPNCPCLLKSHSTEPVPYEKPERFSTAHLNYQEAESNLLNTAETFRVFLKLQKTCFTL